MNFYFFEVAIINSPHYKFSYLLIFIILKIFEIKKVFFCHCTNYCHLFLRFYEILLVENVLLKFSSRRISFNIFFCVFLYCREL